MKREQAVRINDHLLAACAAMDKARMAIAGLGKAERIQLEDWLESVVGALEDEVLLPIYKQYPDLKPPKPDWEPPMIVSELTWSEVRLPSWVTADQLDEIILSCMKPSWRKTAMMVFVVMERCNELGVPVSDEVVAARLRALSESDRIESIGDLRMWRHSEVRLKD